MSEQIQTTTEETGGPIGGNVQSMQVPEPAIFFTGLALVGINSVTNGSWSKIWQAIWNGKTEITRSELLIIGSELLFVAVAVFLASFNADISNVVLALFVALWLVWSVHNANLLSVWTQQISNLTK